MHVTDELIEVDGRRPEGPALPRHAAAAHQRRRAASGCGGGSTAGETEQLLDRLRERIDALVLRTTLMTGFPGETEEQFDELLEFVRRRRFERLGVFAYLRTSRARRPPSLTGNCPRR